MVQSFVIRPHPGPLWSRYDTEKRDYVLKYEFRRADEHIVYLFHTGSRWENRGRLNFILAPQAARKFRCRWCCQTWIGRYENEPIVSTLGSFFGINIFSRTAVAPLLAAVCALAEFPVALPSPAAEPAAFPAQRGWTCYLTLVQHWALFHRWFFSVEAGTWIGLSFQVRLRPPVSSSMTLSLRHFPQPRDSDFLLVI